jgi:T-complex protein 1 subunit delta
VIDEMSIPIELNDRESLLQAATTSLASKVVSQHSDILAPIAVDAVLKIHNEGENNVDLRNVHVCKV